MIDYFDGLGVRFWPSKKVVDYHPEIAGAGLGGRALEPQTFDGRTLGKDDFGRVRRPVPEFALFGGTLMVRRAEVNELLTIYKGSARGVAHGAEARRAVGRRPAALPARHPAGHGQRARREPVRTSCWRAGAGCGSPPPPPSWSARTAGSSARSSPTRAGSCGSARGRGVVLAGGGFSASPEWRGALPALAHAAAHPGRGGRDGRDAARSPRPSAARWGSPATTTRSGSPAPSAAAATAPPPSSRTSGTGPSRGSSRSTQAGRRFVDESVSYHRFVRAMYAAQAVPAWLVIDAAGAAPLRAGHGPPAHPRRGSTSRRGTCTAGATVRELAATIGVDPDGLDRHRRRRQPGRRVRCGRGVRQGAQRVRPPVRRSRRTGPTSTSARSRPRPSTRSPVVPTPLGTALGLRTDAVGPGARRGGRADHRPVRVRQRRRSR